MDRTDITRHGITLNEAREILDRHKPVEITYWHGEGNAYLSIDYEVGMRITLFTQTRTIEEVEQLIRDTKNKTKVDIVESEHCDELSRLWETEPYTQEEE